MSEAKSYYKVPDRLALAHLSAELIEGDNPTPEQVEEGVKLAVRVTEALNKAGYSIIAPGGEF